MAYITGMDKTEVSDTATFMVGQKGMDAAGNTFKYVQYDTGAGSVAAVSGQVAYYYAPSAPTDGQYCWIQIGGTATLTIALTAGADGDPLTPTGAGDGTLDVTAAATSPVCAFAIDASAKIIACQFAG